jgi:hypothetical protein
VTSEPERIEQTAQRLADAATPGEWSAADEHGLIPGASRAWCVSRMDGEKYLYDIAYISHSGRRDQADAEFIAAMRSLVPQLCAEITALRAEAVQYKLSHELMAAQFKVMQREKEHGWREADRWESEAERLGAELGSYGPPETEYASTSTSGRTFFPNGGFPDGSTHHRLVRRGPWVTNEKPENSQDLSTLEASEGETL